MKSEDLLTTIEAGIKEIWNSDTYRAYLRTLSKFHSYSARNCLLILLQNPDATYVAGYRAWQKNFNRQVKRGEKGIAILGYTPQKVQVTVQVKDAAGQPVLDKDGNPTTRKEEKILPRYMPVYVYDISQTEGEPLPTIAPAELTGDVQHYDEIMAALQAESPFPLIFEDPGQADVKGYCSPAAKKIVIRPGMSQVQTIKTAIHEVAHACLHAENAEEKTRREKEVEAESVAYVVCDHFGIDTSDYSFAYLAGWSSRELKEIEGSLTTIQAQAHQLIASIEKRMTDLQQDRAAVQSADEQTANAPAAPEAPRMADAPKLHFTPEQLAAAKEVSALEYAQRQGYELVRHGSSYQMKEHDSMVFLQNGKWFWNSRGLHGGAIEFVMHYEGKTLPEAVIALAGDGVPQRSQRQSEMPAMPAEEPVPLTLPEKAENMKAAIAYLCQTRGIDYNLIRRLAQEGRIYQSSTANGEKVFHNAVFVGLDENGEPRSASLRGCSTQSSFKMEARGSDKAYPFEIPGKPNAPILAVFESAIDALSHASINKISDLAGDAGHRIAIGGNGRAEAIEKMLKKYPDVKQVQFCLDSDDAGHKIYTQLRERLIADGYGHVDMTFVSCPLGKDWNEYLQAWRKVVALHEKLPTTSTQDNPAEPCVGRIHFLSDSGRVEETIAYHNKRHFRNASNYYLAKSHDRPVVIETQEQLRQLQERSQETSAKSAGEKQVQPQQQEPPPAPEKSQAAGKQKPTNMKERMAMAKAEATRRNTERLAQLAGQEEPTK